MSRSVRAVALAAAALALAIPAGAISASSADSWEEPVRAGVHNLDGPLSKEQRELRQTALQMQLAGKFAPGSKVGKVAKGQYVELAREDTDKIFVLIAEFGDERHPWFPDDATGCLGGTNPCFPGDATPQTFDGPMHNEIPEPVRTVDNTTLWQPNYSRAHYEDMYFNRMAEYYERQSSGRYSVDGTVTHWVQVPFNQALYGRDYCGGIVCNTTKALVRDALAVWVQGEIDDGKSTDQIANYLREYDEWDRYDSDGDGNFDEPDGFIDHFQIVHAGGDQAAGDPIYGTDAIWSHRWYANLQAGAPYPGVGVNVGANGGIVSSALVPNNPTGVWVGDYTIQPENGGLGVFAHEYGHDLGLPDLYDTSGNTGGAENSTGFWTLMSSGSNIGDGGRDGIGDDPTDLGAWEKFQLGWLNYEVAVAGKKSEHKLGPAGFNTKQAQGLFVVLPDKKVSQPIGDPASGSYQYYSGAGNDLDNTMTRPISLPAGTVTLLAKANFDIEQDWDYAYLTVNGAPVTTSLSTNSNPNGQNEGEGITGTSSGWVDLEADLSAYAGQTVTLGFRYWTDVAVVGAGMRIDDIAITGLPTDGGETDPGWRYQGFVRATGVAEGAYFNAYLAENRQYAGDDDSLKTAYNFGFLDSRPDWVESFPYQDGILISYWDTSQEDNNVGEHPGAGLLLPIDAHPSFHHYSDGQLVRPRILSFDSTFGLDKTDAVTVHKDSKPTTIPPQSAVPVFDDTKDWWFADDGHGHSGRYEPGWVGVKVPKTGTTIRVKSMTSGGFAQVEVKPKK